MLTCTKHIWQWELQSGEPRGEAEKPLLYYPVRLQDGDVWIDFERELTYNYDD
jgi:toluene monooxygenase system ferredoxin subunit